MTEQLSLFTQNTRHLYGVGSRQQQFFQIAADILNLFLLYLIIFLCHYATCRLTGCLMQRHGSVHLSSVAQLCPTLWPHELQHTRPRCPSQTPGVYSNSCPSSCWCHPAISSSVIPFSCPSSLPASGSFPMSQLFTWGGQSIGWTFSFSISPSNEHPGLISFRMD